jgi:hypothetical protein
LGANELNLEFQDVSCRRAPEFDQYVETGVSLQVLFDHGWWWECGGCRAQTGKDLAGRMIDGEIYCETCPDPDGAQP